MRRLTGWLFDVYAHGDGISVWLIDEQGVAHHLHDQLHPSFFVGGSVAELHRVCVWLSRARLPVRLTRAERYDIFAHCNRVVLQVHVLIPAQYIAIVQRVNATFPTLELYNADLSIAQFYFFERALFPLAYCEVVVNDTNTIVEINTTDSRWALDYRVPSLRCMMMQMEGGALNPQYGHRAPLELIYDDHTYTVALDDPRNVVAHIQTHLARYDPDLIITQWGDSFLLPYLLDTAQQHHVPLDLNRDSARLPQRRPARSYFSYGRIIHKTMAHTLFGRWHIDLQNAALLDYGLDGALELARLTRQPMQQTVRVSTGTGINAMEVSTAYERGALIPYHKNEPEEFKTAADLLTADKGGLTYQPIVGLHFDVAELDFASMYPAIMARFNVSPETMRCACCPQSRVPEIGYSVCRRERGIVPDTLAPLIEKRLAYKQRVKHARSDGAREFYRRRASAQKWLLVTCFGYLGYKNARFGKIEAHEAVTAYGREMLLRAKDLAEARGFRVLHALTDSLWIQKGETKETEYEDLRGEIERATNLPIELEAIYKWVAFLPSRVNPYASVPQRYFGARQSGELKIRGIEARRGDTPEFIKQLQLDLLGELAQASSRAELATRLPRVLEIVAARLDALRAGRVPLADLAFTYRLSRAPDAYATNTLNAIVARDLASRGISLHAGESIRYVITNHQAKSPRDRARATEFLDGIQGYDAARYTELVLCATETLLVPLGVSAPMLNDWFTRALLPAAFQMRVARGDSRAYLGPLFERAETSKADAGKKGLGVYAFA